MIAVIATNFNKKKGDRLVMFYICIIMFTNRYFRKLLHPRVEDIDQVKLIYIFSLVVGLFSALAAALLKNDI